MLVCWSAVLGAEVLGAECRAGVLGAGVPCWVLKCWVLRAVLGAGAGVPCRVLVWSAVPGAGCWSAVLEMTMRGRLQIFACVALLVGCAACKVRDVAEPAPPSAESLGKLDFLADIPEFNGFRLEMTEPELEEVISRNNLGVRVHKSYQVWNQDGENVVIGFREGKCTGIQRLTRDSTLIGKKK